jgi:hypothetical protein
LAAAAANDGERVAERPYDALAEPSRIPEISAAATSTMVPPPTATAALRCRSHLIAAIG